MPNAKFDAKSFNPQAFKYRADRVPRVRLNEMRKSRILAGNPDIRAVFTTQDGTGYARIAMRGLLDGDAVNYDGQTDITATSTKTFEQGVVVVGRAKAWVEKDFSHDITGGIDFMDNVAAQVAEYWQDVDQDTLLAVLRGVFSMTSTKGAEFVKKHTFTVDGPMEATTLNSATAQACGDRKKKFAMIFMHSAVATNLENLNLLTALKYTDKEGVTRDLTLYTWNGKLVITDDGMPVEALSSTRTSGSRCPMKWPAIPRPTAARIPSTPASGKCSPPRVSPTRRRYRPASPPPTRSWRTARTGTWFTPGRPRRRSGPTSRTR